MKIKMILLIQTALWMTAAPLPVQGGVSPAETGLPQTAYHGRPIHFRFEPPDSFETGNLILYTHPLDQPQRIPMTKAGNLFQTTITIEDTSIKMILYGMECFSGRDEEDPVLLANDGDYWEILFYNASNRPMKNALFQRSLSYSGYSGIRRENLPEAVRAVEQEISLYPENRQARLHWYSLTLRINQNSEDARGAILLNIRQVLKESESLADLEFAATAYRLIGEEQQAERIEAKMLEKNPSGDMAARQTLHRVLQIEDPGKRYTALDAFINQFADKTWQEQGLGAMTGAAIQMDDITKMISAVERLIPLAVSPGSASSLAGAAGVLVEKDIDIPLAIQYINKALELIQRAKSTLPPPEISYQEWKESILTTEGRYRDILGWALVKQGKYQEGIEHLLLAVQGTSQPGVYYHLGTALNQSGNTEGAMQYLARAAAFEGVISDMAYVLLDSLWKGLERSDTDLRLLLDREANYIQDRYTDRVLGTEISIPARDFELETLDGDWIRLKDQRGIVVLVFWASWSRSSQQLLRTLPQIASLFPEVLFLTISTDPYYQDAQYVASRLQFQLPVLINNETDQNYDIQGVPTVFVIDSGKTIRFMHKGFNDDFDRRLTIQLEALLDRQQ